MQKIYLFCILTLFGCSKNLQTVQINDNFDIETISVEENINIEIDLYEQLSIIDRLWEFRTKEELLSDKFIESNYYNNFNRIYTREEIQNKIIKSKEFYFLANSHRDKNDYKQALKYYEIALSLYPKSEAFFYQYGVCLMDMNDYEYAEKAFKFVTKEIEGIPRLFFNYPEEEKDTYTFDDNGIVRELYFSYYNLACIYSINNKLDNCMNSIILAIECGYPYIDYIFIDNDLSNLFNSRNAKEIKEKIHETYSEGLKNNFSGKTYDRSWGSTFDIYEFIDDKNIIHHSSSYANIKSPKLYGTYTIKNYHIIINYYKKTYEIGDGQIIGYHSGGGIFDNYVFVEETIDLVVIRSVHYMNSLV